MSSIAQVHRFHDEVAIYVANGKTVYLSTRQASQLARALYKCVRSINRESFVNSSFPTVEIEALSEDQRKGQYNGLTIQRRAVE